MNNIDKVILLSEYFGLDVSNFTRSYHHAIVESEALKKLEHNIQEASKYDNSKVHYLQAEYAKLLEEHPENFEQCVVYNAKINYLCATSYEQFYLNPLEVGTFATSTKSIGELMLKFDGRYVSINDVIMDTSHSLKYKGEAIRKLVFTYHRDMSRTLHKPIEEIKNSKKASENTVKHSLLKDLLLSFVFIILNTYLILLLVAPWHVFSIAVQGNLSNVFTYSYYLPFVATGIFDIFAILSKCLSKRDNENYYYAKRYLNFGTRHVFKTLSEQAVNLEKYIMSAIISHTPLINDIKKYSKVGGDELDLYNLLKDVKDRKRPLAKVINSLCISFLTIALICFVFSLTMFLLQYFKLLGNLA